MPRPHVAALISRLPALPPCTTEVERVKGLNRFLPIGVARADEVKCRHARHPTWLNLNQLKLYYLPH